MPETPPERHRFVAAIDQLAAYLADGEVEQRGIACWAGEAGRTAEDLGWARREVEAEGAGEDVGLVWSWHWLGLALNKDASKILR